MSESQNVEYKESWHDEYLKWICGFANAQGGRLYIGIDDKGHVCGLSNGKKLMEDIPNKVRNTLGIVVDVNHFGEEGSDYIEIVVEPQPYPISYYGEYHYRSGSTKQLLTGQHLTQYLLKKTGLTWDSVPLAVTPTELRFDSFDIFRERAVKSSRMSPENVNIDNIQLLDSLNLLDNGVLKRAGVMLFHHNPENWVAGSYIKIGYFSSETEIVYQDEIHGSLLNQAEIVTDLLYTKYLKGIISYEGISRIETYPYPREAIREAILNAIAHKNYATLIPIQIKVFADKMQISNDCVLPDDWTMEDFLGSHRSRPYNPLIANTFYRAGYIESWGRGIQKISEACLNAGNEEPTYRIRQDEITVEFKAKPSIGEPKPSIGEPKPSIGEAKSSIGEAKSSIGEEKSSIGEEKSSIGETKSSIEARREAFLQFIQKSEGYSSSLNNLITAFDNLCDAVYFSRKDLMSVCDIQVSRAGDLLTILKESNIIEPVSGHGKGKYRFIV